MAWPGISLLRSDYSKLIPVLALAFYVTYIPHAGYPYPVHVDEWVHMAYSGAIQQAGSAIFPEPFTGTLVGIGSNLEIGFQLFWAVFQKVTGIPWIDVYRLFPSIIAVFAVLAVFVLAQRQGFGWEAAFFAALIPTTVGILGPAFLVPVAMGLLFVPLCLFLAFNFRSLWSYLVLLLLVAYLVSIHAPSAISVGILLVPYIFMSLKGSFRHSALVTAALAIPFLAPFPWIFRLLLPTFLDLANPVKTADYVQLPRVIPGYGEYPIALCLLGIAVLTFKRGKKNFGLALGLLAMLLMLAAFYTLQRGVPIVYERGLLFAILGIGIVAGAGLMGVRRFEIPERFLPGRVLKLAGRYVGAGACIALIVLTLTNTIPVRQNTGYYHMIDTYDYEAFEWIRDNLPAGEKAVLEPWKGTAFSAVTMKTIYSRIHSAPDARSNAVLAFLKAGAADTGFLRQNGISIVYSRWAVNNPDLVKVRDSVYILKSG